MRTIATTMLKSPIETSGVQAFVGMSGEQLEALTDEFRVKKLEDLALLDRGDVDLILGRDPASFMVRKKLATLALFLRKGGKFTPYMTIQDIITWECAGGNTSYPMTARMETTTLDRLFPTEEDDVSSPAKEGGVGQENNDRCLGSSSPTMKASKKKKYVQIKYPYFSYEDDPKRGVQTWWQVPKDFVIPTCDRQTGWKFWLMGIPNYRVPTAGGGSKIHPICPFRKFELRRLPNKLRKQFGRGWTPLYKTMETDQPDLPDDISEYDEEKLNSTYQVGTETLKRCVEYIFLNKRKCDTWSVSTWSKALRPSEILMYGTDRDKANLPPSNGRNGKKRLRKEEPDSEEEIRLPSIKNEYTDVLSRYNRPEARS